MLTRTNLFPRLRVAIFLSLMSGMIATINTRDAAAQGRQPNFIIEISLSTQNACFYELQDPDGTRRRDQDLLSVKPGNRVKFTSTNAQAAIAVSKNDSTAFPGQGNNQPGFTGGQQNNDFVLPPGSDKTVNARANNGKGNSRHKIGIMCVVELESNTKPSGPSFDAVESIILIPAVRLPDSHITIPGPNWTEIRIPDFKRLPPSPLREAGGPDMEVEEDD